MLSLPDMREKQLLFVNAEWGEKTLLKYWNDNLVFMKGGKVENRASCHKALAVFVTGDTAITTPLLRGAQEHGVSLVFLKNNFEPYATFFAEAEGHWLLREKQYTCTDAQSLTLAKHIVAQKMLNQATLLQQIDALSKDPRTVKAELRAKVSAAKDMHELLGLEGNYSKVFFARYFKSLGWRRRAPRTKEDVPNLLLDTGYTFLFNLVDALLRLHGFDTYKGVYHQLFYARRSLACDIMEPCRSIIDKQVAKAYSLGQIQEKDFTVKNGMYLLPYPEAKKYTRIFSEALMARKNDIYTYVHGYYRHIMDPEKNEFPTFAISSC